MVSDGIFQVGRWRECDEKMVRKWCKIAYFRRGDGGKVVISW